MDGTRRLVEEAVEATEITSESSFAWFGRRSTRLPAAARRTATRATVREHLVASLQAHLYEHFYQPGVARAADETVDAGTPFGEMEFVERLSDANRGSGSWDGGWTRVGKSGDAHLVERDGLRLLVRDGDRRDETNRHVVSVRFPKELRGMSPGYYMALSDQPLAGSAPLLRLYWNLLPAAAVGFMALATEMLNGERVGFKLKLVNDPVRYERCDNGVLYLRRTDFPRVRPLLETLRSRCDGAFATMVPALTKALAPGVGLAEDPGGTESFGMHRCRLLAEGLVDAHEHGARAVRDRLVTVDARFRSAGLSLDSPHLEPGGRDDAYSAWAAPRRGGAPALKRALAAAASGEAFLDAACRIGRDICSDAIWHDGRCNWIGAQPSVGEDGRASAVLTYGALGPDVYAGTAGIAVFLAELACNVDEPRLATTAVGAARQAAHAQDAVSPENRVGLYTGWVGMAVALVRAGALLGRDELIELGARLGRRAAAWAGSAPGPCEHDFLGGRAGGAAGLLALDRLLGGDEFRACASSLGDAILRDATADAGGQSWASAALPARRNLTGLSHGAAGIAVGLLELYRATGDERYRRCATSAFDYERSVFLPEVANWPDYRDAGGAGRRLGGPGTCVFWCHGAPGIALARIRALSVVHDDRWRAEASSGLGTTRRAIEADLGRDRGNFSLCHGLAGNADVLLEGAAAGLAEGDDELARAVGAFGLDQHLAAGTWPCGIGRGQTPGLMLGLAGIGGFYLRLSRPSSPTALMFDIATAPAVRAGEA